METCRVVLLSLLIFWVRREKAFIALCQLSENLSMQVSGNIRVVFLAFEALKGKETLSCSEWPYYVHHGDDPSYIYFYYSTRVHGSCNCTCFLVKGCKFHFSLSFFYIWCWSLLCWGQTAWIQLSLTQFCHGSPKFPVSDRKIYAGNDKWGL